MENNLNLAEEVFCLNVELNTLAGVLLKSESERWVPGYLYSSTEKSHYDRYHLAKNYSESKKVIDIACGVGKGSYILADEGKAEMVDSFDIDNDAIRYAKHRNYHKNIQFMQANAEQLAITDKYDLAVSFETIEHLKNYRSFLQNIQNALKTGGYFLVSTPISPLAEDKTPTNPYHVQEWGFKSFQDLIKEYFTVEKVFVQIYPSTLDAFRNRVQPSRNLIERVNRKLFSSKKSTSANSQNHFSKIEEFTGQFSEEELKVHNIGYQIVLARK